MRKVCTALLVFTLLLGLSTAVWATDSGDLSKSTTWSFDNGVMTIDGSGTMSGNDLSYTIYEIPFWNYRDSIVKAIITGGITKVDNYAFWNCASLTEVEIGGAMKVIGFNTFANDKLLQSVYTRV